MKLDAPNKWPDPPAKELSLKSLEVTTMRFNTFLLDQVPEVTIAKPGDPHNTVEFPTNEKIHGWIRETISKTLERSRHASSGDTEITEPLTHMNWLLFSVGVNSLAVKLDLDLWAVQNDLNLWEYLFDVEQIYLFD